jgi:hypothetical protein
LLGQPVAFSMRLDHVNPDQPVNVQCEGTVVRVEPGEERFGVAVSLSAFEF